MGFLQKLKKGVDKGEKPAQYRSWSIFLSLKDASILSEMTATLGKLLLDEVFVPYGLVKIIGK